MNLLTNIHEVEPLLPHIDPAILPPRVPRQRPGRSEQSVATPRDFLDAVEARFGKIDLDVAAESRNAVCQRYYALDHGFDGLRDPWVGNLNWCNPPFSKIAPWLEKARASAAQGHTSLVLIPASVGSNWWRDHVHRKCDVALLNGRLTFVGHTSPYPKDLALLVYYDNPFDSYDYAVWDWRKNEVWR
jgi:phage N-6-adenine-methyltransferase